MLRLDTADRGAETRGPVDEPVIEMVVRERSAVADRVVLLTLEASSGAALPAWEPGAHVDLLFEPDLVRQYSLCGDPADRSRFEIAVLREPNGRGGSAQDSAQLSATRIQADRRFSGDSRSPLPPLVRLDAGTRLRESEL